MFSSPYVPLLLIALFAANLRAIFVLIQIAQSKGHYQKDVAELWIIGIFGSALLVGIIVCALPDLPHRNGPLDNTSRFGQTN